MIALVALAGGLGAVCRFVVDGELATRHRSTLPLGTLLINLLGSGLLGLLIGAQQSLSGQLSVILGTGFCGGFTTFSTASVETARLWLAHGVRRALWYLGLSVAGAASTAMVGLQLGRLLG